MARLDSYRRADHFSYINFFNPSYGLKDMNFQSFLNILELFFIQKIRIIRKIIQNSAFNTFCTEPELAADTDQWGQATATSAGSNMTRGASGY